MPDGLETAEVLDRAREKAHPSPAGSVRGTVIPPEILDAVSELPALVPFERAAEFLNTHPSTLRRWVRAGRVQVLKSDGGASGRVSILRSEVARLLAGMIAPTPFRG